jgi:putative thioredoxin
MLDDQNLNTILHMSKVNTSLESFERDVIEASAHIPVLVDFWAEWCSPCLVIAPVLERIVDELQGRIRLVKLEVDQGENMKLAGHYRVRGFPTVMLFHQGKELARFSGARSRTQIIEFLTAHMGSVDAASGIR